MRRRTGDAVVTIRSPRACSTARVPASLPYRFLADSRQVAVKTHSRDDAVVARARRRDRDHHLSLREAVARLFSESISPQPSSASSDLKAASASPIRALRCPASTPTPAKTARWGGGPDDRGAGREVLRGEGIRVRGPMPADTMFHGAARKTYDCAICMYHDQALIPIKTIAFEDAVNVTLGLPSIRASPDHGTAFDIAGSGSANPSSLIAACGWRPHGVGAAGMSADRRPAPLRDVIRQPFLSARRSDRTSCSTSISPPIAPAAGPLENTTVVEIGPGPGGLTRALRRWARNTSSRWSGRARAGAARRHRTAISGRLEIVCADAQTSIRALCSTANPRRSSPTCPTTSPPRLIDWLSIEPWPPGTT